MPTTNRPSRARTFTSHLPRLGNLTGSLGDGARGSRQHAHEPDDVGFRRRPREEALRQQPDDLRALADHDVGREGQPPLDFSVQLLAADPLTDDERAGRADVHGIEMLQLLGEGGWPEAPVTADVEAPQKNYQRHEPPTA